MPAYSGKAQPYLDAIAAGAFASSTVRDWLLQGTRHDAAYAGAEALHDEQRAVRWKTKKTTQPFWANYWCGRDGACTCRIEGSKGLESDAIFFLRNAAGRVLAMHLEFKHRGEAFGHGQPEAYPLRAACFAKNWESRRTLNPHHDWITVLVHGGEADPRLVHFDRRITHDEARQMLETWPGLAASRVG